MKKYITPDISFNILSLSTNISAGCEIISNNDVAVCPVEVPGQPGFTIFQEGSGCIAYHPGYEDSICYHIPIAEQNVFES